MKKNDLLLIGIILVVILIAFPLISLFKTDGAYVVIRIDGQETARYSLAQNGQYALNGGTNTLSIEQGKACLISADCPDLLCVKQGTIDETGETITCLPNRLTVTVYGAADAEVELIS